MAVPSNAAPALPVLATVGQTFRLIWLNRDDFVRVAIVPMAATYVIVLIAFGADPHGHPEGAPVESWALSLVGISHLLLTTLFSVGWLRVLLLRSERGRRDFGLRWTRAHAIFLGRMVLLSVGIALTLLLVSTLAGGAMSMNPSASMRLPAVLVLLLACVVALYVWQRLSLVFPAAAIAHHPYGFLESWRHTARYGFQLLLIVVLSFGLVAMAYLAVHGALFPIVPLTAMLIEQALTYLFNGAMLGIWAIAFHRFSGWRESPAPVPVPD
jgi:hypothetical protein